MNRARTEISMRVVHGSEELAVSWLAENGVLPVKSRAGRYTLEEPPGTSRLTRGEKMLIVGKFDVTSEAELEALRERIVDHPRWTGRE